MALATAPAATVWAKDPGGNGGSGPPNGEQVHAGGPPGSPTGSPPGASTAPGDPRGGSSQSDDGGGAKARRASVADPPEPAAASGAASATVTPTATAAAAPISERSATTRRKAAVLRAATRSGATTAGGGTAVQGAVARSGPAESSRSTDDVAPVTGSGFDAPARRGPATVRKQPGDTARNLALDEAEGVPELRPSAQEPLLVRSVRDVAEVVPMPIRLALTVLGALVLLLAGYIALAAVRTRRLRRQRAELLQDIGLLQAALLPAVPPRLGSLATTVAYRPADGPAAGGDFYDAFPLEEGRVGLLLGDISGHGRQALAKTTLVRYTVRAHLEAGLSPRAALAVAGRSLDGRLSDDFATVIAAVHDPTAGTLTYSSAGHPPPIVLGGAAGEPITASSAPPLGAGFPTGHRQSVLPMPDGTTVCLYSDGLSDARVDGKPLGRRQLAVMLSSLGPRADAEQLLGLIVRRAERLPDDLAACVLHAAPGAAAPATRLEQLKLDVLDVDAPRLEGFLIACGVSAGERARVGRRASDELAVSGGVIVEVRIGDHPTVRVKPIGDDAATAAAQNPPAMG